MKELQNVYINPKNSIVVIVDMVNAFCKPGGSHYSERSARVMPEIISHIRNFAEHAREVGIPIIYIQTIRTLREPEFTVFGAEPYLQMGTWAPEIIDELRPHEGDTVVQKFSHDCFIRPELDRVLEKLVPEPTRCFAVVCGGAVSVCVHHATMGFWARNYWTVVPVDCVYPGMDPEIEGAQMPYSRGYRNVFLSRSDLIEISPVAVERPLPIPGR